MNVNKKSCIYQTDGKFRDTEKYKHKQKMILALHSKGYSYEEIGRKVYGFPLVRVDYQEHFPDGSLTPEARKKIAFDAFVENVIKPICEGSDPADIEDKKISFLTGTEDNSLIFDLDAEIETADNDNN